MHSMPFMLLCMIALATAQYYAIHAIVYSITCPITVIECVFLIVLMMTNNESYKDSRSILTHHAQCSLTIIIIIFSHPPHPVFPTIIIIIIMVRVTLGSHSSKRPSLYKLYRSCMYTS